MSGVNFFSAYSFAWLFWLSISLGAMALAMMHQLTGGNWGVLIRPIAAAATRVMPLMFVLFLPMLLGLRYLFPWSRPDELHTDPILMHLHPYLNPQLFALRFLIYFAIWIGMIWGLNHIKHEGFLRRLSAGGLVVYVVSMSLAGVDWMMSRQLHWVSSIFGFIVVVSQTLTALCFVIFVFWHRMDRPAIRNFAKPAYFTDLGNMLLMFIILWAYLKFAQFLITWTGNEQPDIAYYVQRTYGGWRFVAGIIIFIHFLIPFFMLLSRDLKRDIRRLGILCGALLVLRVLDLFWEISPLGEPDPHGGFHMSIWDPFLFLLIGAAWLYAFRYFLRQAPDLTFSAESEPHAPQQSPAV
jgi:hypothetical protein